METKLLLFWHLTVYLPLGMPVQKSQYSPFEKDFGKGDQNSDNKRCGRMPEWTSVDVCIISKVIQLKILHSANDASLRQTPPHYVLNAKTALLLALWWDVSGYKIISWNLTWTKQCVGFWYWFKFYVILSDAFSLCKKTCFINCITEQKPCLTRLSPDSLWIPCHYSEDHTASRRFVFVSCPIKKQLVLFSYLSFLSFSPLSCF